MLDIAKLVNGLKRYEAEGGTWSDLSRLSKIPDPTISRIANGVTKNARPETWEKIHQAIPDYVPAPSFVGQNATIDRSALVKVPVFDAQGGADGGWTDGAYPVGASSAYEFLPREMVDEHSFVVKIHGDSMAPYLPEGSHALVVPSAGVENGRLVFVSWPGETGDKMVKRYYRHNGTIILRSDNQNYPDILLDAKRDKGVRIYRVTWVQI